MAASHDTPPDADANAAASSPPGSAASPGAGDLGRPAGIQQGPDRDALRARRDDRRRDRLAAANFGGAIYGQILVLSVLVVAGRHVDLAGEELLLTVLGSQLVFWIAHAYAHTIGDQIKSGEAGHEGLGRAMEHEWPIVQAAGPTVLLAVLSLLGAFSPATAVDLAIGAGVLQLFGWGFVAARRTKQTLVGRLTAGLVAGGLGLVIVALKLAIH